MDSATIAGNLARRTVCVCEAHPLDRLANNTHTPGISSQRPESPSQTNLRTAGWAIKARRSPGEELPQVLRKKPQIERPLADVPRLCLDRATPRGLGRAEDLGGVPGRTERVA